MKEENVASFVDRFENYVAENILLEQTSPQIDIDMELGFEEITPEFYACLKQFSPVGPGNMKPVFSTQGVVDAGSRLVGRNQEHLKLEVRDPRTSITLNGIAFGMHEHYAYIKSGAPFDICYTIEENNFKGITSMQLQVKDIRPAAGK